MIKLYNNNEFEMSWTMVALKHIIIIIIIII